jgi:hypothetical protein
MSQRRNRKMSVKESGVVITGTKNIMRKKEERNIVKLNIVFFVCEWFLSEI